MYKYLQMTVDSHLQMKVILTLWAGEIDWPGSFLNYLLQRGERWAKEHKAGLLSIDKPVILAHTICTRLTYFVLELIQ